MFINTILDMIKKNTATFFLDICKKSGYNEQEVLSFLLVIKKIFNRYGIVVTKKEIIDIVYMADKDIGTIIAILNILEYNTNDKLDVLIKSIQRSSRQSYYTIETSKGEKVFKDINAVIQSIEKQDIVVEKNLKYPGIHVYTDSHKYHRDIDSDLNNIFRR